MSFVIGLLLAVLCYRFELLCDIISPIMTTLKIVPMVSFVIMLLIWVGNQALMNTAARAGKVFMAILNRCSPADPKSQAGMPKAMKRPM